VSTIEDDMGMQDRAGVGLRTIIIGAGMAGLLAAIRLRQRGETNFAVYEKGSSVGGTWRENTYPGLACDTPAHSYTYSFAFNPEWSAFYAPGPEIRAYFEAMAERFGLGDYICFNAEIESCEWSDGKWRVRTKSGETDTGDVLIAATGVLHHPKYPDIPGLDTFERAVFHSARWDHSVPLEGKRVGVIGNGSTGVQIVSALTKVANRIVHFQRSPQWIMPSPDIRYSEEDKLSFRSDPARIEAVRSGPEATARKTRFTNAIIDVNSAELAEIQTIVEKNLEDSIADPDLREKLRPNYRAACKRMVFSPHYYNAVQEPSVYLETGRIARIEPTGVRMVDGTFHELDVLALATGFKVDQFVRPAKILGENGLDLDEVWKDGPRAYYAVTVPHFPNFALLNGPTGPVGNFSLVDIAEKQWDYFDQLLEPVRDGRAAGIAPTVAALEGYEAKRDAKAMGTVFASGCSSWYLNDKGVPQVWPWSYDHFVDVMSAPKLEDYQIVEPAAAA
jgi:cation diffusion facilitator CzcD-associated flavoprotein CzcO